MKGRNAVFGIHLSGLIACFEGWVMVLFAYITLNKGGSLTI